MVETAIVASGTSPTAVELGLEKGAFRFLSFFRGFRPGHVGDRCLLFLALSFSLAAFSFSLFSLVSFRILVLGIIPFSFVCSLVSFTFAFTPLFALAVLSLVKGVSFQLGISHFCFQ